MKNAQHKSKAQLIVDSLNRNVARDQSVLNEYIRGAIAFTLKTHELDQKQKRKGKDIPYIMHPLTVGLILAKAGAPEHIIAAGILHDTMEDSVPEKKVTYETLFAEFSPAVADIVKEVTETDKKLSWKERKLLALVHIKTMQGPSLLVKTADVISNISELLDDYAVLKDDVFLRFNAPKADVIANHRAVVAALIKRWNRSPFGQFRKSENPMVLDLKTLADDLAALIPDRDENEVQNNTVMPTNEPQEEEQIVKAHIVFRKPTIRLAHQFAERFKAMSNDELIEAFNREVGKPGWVSSGLLYLEALRNEFYGRGYDLSAISGDGKGFSIARRIRLEGNKIVLV